MCATNNGLMWVAVIILVVGLFVIWYNLRGEERYDGRVVGLVIAAVGTIASVCIGMRA